MRAISLLYHDVVRAGHPDASGFPGPGPARYKFDEAEFEMHLQAIGGALSERPIAVTDLKTSSQRPLPRLLTVDDGGVSALRIADLFEERGWRGHFLITGSRIGTPSFVNEEQLRDLSRRGHALGSHSWSHPERMSRLRRPELLEEWGRSVNVLSDILGERVRVASVPGGYYSKEVARAAAQAGIEALFTSEPRTLCRDVEGCLVLGRFTLWRGMPVELSGAFAAGRTGPRLEQWLAWNLKKVAKTLGGELYLKLRKRLVKES